MVGCRSCTYPSILLKKNTWWTPSSELQKKWGAVGTSTRAVPAQANHSTSRRRRFQTGPCLEILFRNWYSHQTPCSVFHKSNGEKDVETQARVGHTGQPTRETTERRAVQRRTPGAVRCTAPSATSEVRMLELAHVNQLRFRRCWRVRHGRVVFFV